MCAVAIGFREERGSGAKFESSRGMDEWMGFPEIALPAYLVYFTCFFCLMLQPFSLSLTVLGREILLPMGCVKLGNKFAGCSPTEGRQTQFFSPSLTQPIASNNFGPSRCLFPFKLQNKMVNFGRRNRLDTCRFPCFQNDMIMIKQ